MRFIHIRQASPQGLDPKGGLTIAYDKMAANEVGFHWAKCCSSDVFNKRVGRLIAMGRFMRYGPEHIIHVNDGEKIADTIIGFVADTLFADPVVIIRSESGHLISDF